MTMSLSLRHTSVIELKGNSERDWNLTNNVFKTSLLFNISHRTYVLIYYVIIFGWICNVKKKMWVLDFFFCWILYLINTDDTMRWDKIIKTVVQVYTCIWHKLPNWSKSTLNQHQSDKLPLFSSFLVNRS